MPDRDMMVPQPSKREQKREAAEYQKRGATAKKPTAKARTKKKR